MRYLRVVVVAAMLASCSDEGPSKPPLDTSTTLDLQIQDGPPTVDGPVSGKDALSDGPASGKDALSDGPAGAKDAKTDGAAVLSCSALMTCARTCSKKCAAFDVLCLSGCNDSCSKTGCPSAAPVFNTLTGCIGTKCLLDCIGGNWTACDTCTQGKCGGELAACNAHSC